MYLIQILAIVNLLTHSTLSHDEATSVAPTNITKPVVSEAQCFHQPIDACLTTNVCSCKRISMNSALCCNVSQFLLTEGLACASMNFSLKKLTLINEIARLGNLIIYFEITDRCTSQQNSKEHFISNLNQYSGIFLLDYTKDCPSRLLKFEFLRMYFGFFPKSWKTHQES